MNYIEKFDEILETFELDRADEGVFVSPEAYSKAKKALTTLLQESNEEAVREFIDWVMGVKAGENLGMGSLDYHEKLVINGFKEYIKFHFIEGSYLSSRGDKGEI